MPSIPKPAGLSLIWAAQGTKTAPEPDKINQGWVVELPPYQTANYIENKQDQFNAHANQYGIPVWDNVTEYQGGKSVVQGSNGTVYKCTTTHTGADPVNPLNANRWKIAFEDYGAVALLQAEVNTFRTNYGTLNALVNKEAARINLQVYSRVESDDRFALKAGNVSTNFNVAHATSETHAVPLGQLNMLLGGGIARFATATEVKQGTLTGVTVSPDTGRQAYLMQANNLSDLQSPASARSNLGLTSTATTAPSAFVSAISVVGQVATFAGTTSPAGWLICDGRAVSRGAYPDLFAVIGTNYGSGDGSTTFNLPDCRNEFIRGWTGNTSSVGTKFLDTYASHTHSGSTNTTGSHIHYGSAASAGAHSHSADTGASGYHRHSITKHGDRSSGQMGNLVYGDEDNYPNRTEYTNYDGNHTHTVNVYSAGSHTHSISMDYQGAHSHTLTIGASGGTETRPRGIYMLVCIRH